MLIRYEDYSQCLEPTGIDDSSAFTGSSDDANNSSLLQRPTELFKANKPLEDSSIQSRVPSLQTTKESSRPISPLFQSFQEIDSDVSSSDTLAADRASAIGGAASQTSQAAAAINTGDTLVADGSLPTSNDTGSTSGSIATITVSLSRSLELRKLNIV